MHVVLRCKVSSRANVVARVMKRRLLIAPFARLFRFRFRRQWREDAVDGDEAGANGLGTQFDGPVAAALQVNRSGP